MSKKQGKKFGNRTLTQTESDSPVQANQWQNSQKQQLWLKYYMDPSEKETWGNGYQAAIKAGYSESYARNIMSPSLALQWVQQAKQVMRLNPEHLKLELARMIGDKYTKDSDKIAAIKLLGTDQGMFVQKQLVGVVTNIEQALNELE